MLIWFLYFLFIMQLFKKLLQGTVCHLRYITNNKLAYSSDFHCHCMRVTQINILTIPTLNAIDSEAL